MSFNNSGLDGLTLNSSTILAPIGTLSLSGSVGTDFILPEDVSDSEKILMSDCQIKVGEVLSANGIVTVTGNAFFNILLLGEDGSISGVKTSEQFEIKDFLDGVNDSSILVLGGTFGETNCRLVNPRKLNLASDVTIDIYVISERSVDPSIKGSESIDDEMCLKRRTESVDYLLPCSLSERAIPVSHDITLDGNYPPMSEILYYDVKVIPFETKALGSNVTVKTKAVFSCVYKSEEGNVFAFEKPFTLEASLETDNADSYEWFASAVPDDISAEIAIDNYGDAKLIELDFTYDILLNGVRNMTVNTVTDAYSTEYECQSTVENSKCCTYRRTYSSSLSVNASADRDSISAENVRSVMLGNVAIKDIAGEYNDEKKRLITEANAVISAVCENNITSEDDPRYSAISFEYPFKCELDVGEINEKVTYTVSAHVTDVRFRCDQNKIYCDFENAIMSVITETVESSYLTEIVINKAAPVADPYAPITLCYPSGDETLWDIAKYYKVTTDGIVAENKLENENISGRKVLLIPSFKKSTTARAKAN